MNLKARGYQPRDYYYANGELREVIDLISDGAFSNGDREVFRPIVSSLLNNDEYLLLADYESYINQQALVSETFVDVPRWTKMSILNVARSGYFSSDRSIREYCDHIWNVEAVRVE
jgi:starch phosphorylase